MPMLTDPEIEKLRALVRATSLQEVAYRVGCYEATIRSALTGVTQLMPMTLAAIRRELQ